MSTRLFGVLVDGLNKPIINATVTLLARQNTLTILNGSEAIFRTDAAGFYNITVQSGHYNVIIGPQGIEPYKAGEIALYADSEEGSLNGYLVNWVPEELTPEVIKEVQDLVARSEAFALDAGRSASAANLDATDARGSKAASQSAAADALVYKNDAKNEADAAKLAQQGASGSANTATQAMTTTKGYRDEAEGFKNTATTAATTATDKALEAAGSATTAGEKAVAATSAADRAETAASSAEQVTQASLKKDQNLKDLTNTGLARTNLELDRFSQSTNETVIYSPDKIKYIGISNGISASWGAFDSTSGGKWIPLGVGQGGTGSNTDSGARINLKLDRFQQQDNGTFIRGNGNFNVGLFIMDGAWGAMNLSTGARIALPINNGGTGALDVNGARNNLGLGINDIPTFQGLTAATNYNVDSTNGGILASNLFTSTGVLRSLSRIYNAINGPTGEVQTVIHTKNDVNGVESYCTFNNSGLLSINSLGVVGKSRTGTLSVVDRMTVGTPGDATALGARSIAIGDHDTGFAQRSDGVLDVYTDAANLCSFTTSGFTTKSNITSSTPPASSGLYLTGNGRSGGENAMVRGKVDGVDFWDGWRDQASGMLVEMPRVGVISTIWKATHWGTNHVAAMQVYYPTSGIWYTSIVTGGARCIFGSDGVNSASNWLSTSDIRLKAQLKEILSAKEKVKVLQGYTYFKRNNLDEDKYSFYSEEAGLIAQDVQTVLPEAVYKVANTEYLSISYAGVTALLTNAMKEMMEDAEAQDKRITTLEDEVAQLKLLVSKLVGDTPNQDLP